jgi:hypothetical protein
MKKTPSQQTLKTPKTPEAPKVTGTVADLHRQALNPEQVYISKQTHHPDPQQNFAPPTSEPSQQSSPYASAQPVMPTVGPNDTQASFESFISSQVHSNAAALDEVKKAKSPASSRLKRTISRTDSRAQVSQEPAPGNAGSPHDNDMRVHARMEEQRAHHARSNAANAALAVKETVQEGVHGIENAAKKLAKQVRQVVVPAREEEAQAATPEVDRPADKSSAPT